MSEPLNLIVTLGGIPVKNQQDGIEAFKDACTPTPPHQAGTWTLTAPDGRTWQADSPLRACAIEQRERVPASVAYARIMAELKRTEDADRKAEQADSDLRARLSLEQRDEPRQRGYSMIDDDSGQPKQGELP